MNKGTQICAWGKRAVCMRVCWWFVATQNVCRPVHIVCVMQVEMIAWMEKELKQGDQAVVLVTHDR